MRLTCPNCSARYEVDDSLVPPEGRDVQCSNCATTWFQPGNRARVEEPETAPAAAAAAPRRDLDPALRDILREEREREEQLRRAAAPVEEQEEMALDDPAPAPRATQTGAPEPDEEDDEDTAAIREMVAESVTPADRRGARDLFPDIEEINSTLRATTDRSSSDRATSDVDSMDVRPRRRRGFRTGLMLMLILAAAAIGAYVFQPDIVAALPQAEPYLTPYVEQVDQLRFQLDDLVQSLASQLADSAGN
ncbi:zinc-ribbon domain-containing protein [Nioella ostreopsis]|uniref:zinc-ribbon domain-containing protein n=1 Tax=Nioella ostreopsis TaxID=2448479 RepID=UPI0013DF46AD|nr:zinc-ribbon domain-containing protein [Nioella ostreopsis]